NAINLPHVIRFNAAEGGAIVDGYRDVSEVLGLEGGGPDREVGDRLASHLAGLVASLGLPTRLSLVGVPEEGVPALVDGAMGDGTESQSSASATSPSVSRPRAARL